MPRVTVVLPVYNAAGYVEQSLRSVLAQDYEDFEIVAVDDGSTDGSIAVLDRYRNRVRVIETVHCGPAAARNRALETSDSEFVAFMDADDRCVPHRLRVQSQALEEGFDFVASRLSFIDSSGGPLPGEWRRPVHAANDAWGALLERNWIGTPSVMLRRDVLESAGFFDESFRHAEDYDLWLRIGRQSRIGYIDTPLVECRRHAANMSRDVEAHQRFETLALGKVDPAEARAAFGRLYADAQRQDEAWIWFLLRRGGPEFAEESAAALRRHPDSREIRFASGVFLHDGGMWELAQSVFLSLNPQDAASRHNVLILSALRGDSTDVAAGLQAILEERPDYHDARRNLDALLSGDPLRLTRRPFREHLVPVAEAARIHTSGA